MTEAQISKEIKGPCVKRSLRRGNFVSGCKNNGVDWQRWGGETCESNGVHYYACPCDPPFTIFHPLLKQHLEWILS